MTGGSGRYRIRLHARRLRRSGLEPIAIVNPSDPLPEIAIVLICRWLWRYRSELAPAAVALVVFGVSWWLHRAHPSWWLWIALLAVATAAAVVLTGTRLGLVTPAERWYAALVAAVAGGWLSAATVAGPDARPLPIVLLTAGSGLAVP